MLIILHLAQTLASFALVLGILVSIHEAGHYTAARLCGIHVEAFSLGFGPALKAWVDRRGTVWKICVLPLGGYVKMHGMALDARSEAETDASAYRRGEAYFEKSVRARAFVAAAGPLANFALAIVLFAALDGIVGQQVPLPVVGQVIDGSAAALAGLRVDDEIRSVDGAAVPRFQDLKAIVVASPDRILHLSVRRGNADLDIPVHIPPQGAAHAAQLGVISGRAMTLHLNPVAAVAAGATDTWEMLRQTVLGLVAIVTTGRGADGLGGPIMIAQLSGKVAQLGVASLINFIAILSVNLGLVNLLPIPILDGGHLMFYAAEAVRGRPVPQRAQEYGYRVGFAIIACIFAFAFKNDLTRAGAFKWLGHLIG